MFEVAVKYFTVLAALVGGVFTLYTYARNSKLKRAEWLYNLYVKFYEESQYKNIRRIIDYESPDDIEDLKSAIGGDDDKLTEELVDYLNFFEFISSLWAMGQLSHKEISMVFQYYILRIFDHDFIVDFMREEGFKQLPLLAQKLRSEEKR